MKKIVFNIPPLVGDESKYVEMAICSHKICGDGQFTKKCHAWMEERFNAKKVLLTTSGTTALDMAMILCDIQPGDEVILPSYTFSSTATSAVSVGAKLVFVDIRPDTMNIDENKIEEAITDRTKVIMVMHYAGVACEMDTIMDIAKRHNLIVVEDAAQGIMSKYKGKFLGTIGDLGCYSFHETKNLSMGEGGALVVNNSKFCERSEIIREKGTNRANFFRGLVDKYTWVDRGGSFLPSELNAAYLWAQLQKSDEIFENRMKTWKLYYDAFIKLSDEGRVELQSIPDECIHNAHMFYIKLKDIDDRNNFIDYMKDNGISCVFHYIPLHSSPAGTCYGRMNGMDQFTTKESERLVRLPMYYGIEKTDCEIVIKKAYDYLWR